MDVFNYEQIPNHMMRVLHRYIYNHEPVGDFLRAVLCNDLMGACGRADSTNIELLPVYAAYLYNEAPAACHGSKDKYEAWIK